jgi:putative endonuclease
MEGTIAYKVYVLQSEKSGRLYIGYTQDLNRRLEEHNTGQTTSTRNKGPWELLFAKSVRSKPEALQLERKLKSWKSNTRVKAWIAREKEKS